MATTLAKISIKDNSSWNTYLNLIYPVGSVYFSYTSTSPADRFGGTWSSISNKFIYTGGVGTGGSSSVSHYHTSGAGYLHACISPRYQGNVWSQYTVTSVTKYNGGFNADWAFNTGELLESAVSKVTTAVPVDGQTKNASVSIVPVYQQLYCWRRTA